MSPRRMCRLRLAVILFLGGLMAGRNYCVQVKTNLLTPWAMSMNLGCVTATNTLGSLDDPSLSGSMQRFYRVGRQP